MSNNPKKEKIKEETKLIGNKTKAENEIKLKEEKGNICHLCEKEKSSFLECSKCHIFFCDNCISNIISKEKFEKLISDDNEKLKWICFICQKNCPCKNCSNDNFCLLCNEKYNLINYYEKIKKLPYSKEENNILKTKDKDIQKILENEEKSFICLNCIQNNKILSNFLNAKPFSLLIEEKEEKEEKNKNTDNNNNIEKKPKETIFNVLDKQIGYFPQNENIINNINYLNHQNINNNNVIENSTLKDFQQVFNEENQKNSFPGINNNLDNQIPFYMNFPRNINLNNNNTKELSSTFTKIAESLTNFNGYNLKNNLNVLSNINQLTEIISTMLNDSNKKGEEKKEDNNSSNSMISSMMIIIEDLKKQINVIQYYTQLQKFFIANIMKYLELFIEQISNQNFLNESKGNFLNNQIPNLFPMSISNLNNINPPVMNIFKQMPSIPINTNTNTIIPGLNIPNIPSLNLNQNNNNEKKEQNKNNNFNLMFQQNNQNSIPLKMNGLNPMINNIPIPNLQEQNMFDQIKNSMNSNLNKMNNQFIPNQNNNNPNLNNQIPNITNQLFPQFNLNNQSMNPQNLFFNNQNNNNNDNINNINNMTTNINHLGNIPNLNNNNQSTFNPSLLNQTNPFFYQMLLNNQNPIDLNDKGVINNPQIKKDN